MLRTLAPLRRALVAIVSLSVVATLAPAAVAGAQTTSLFTTMDGPPNTTGVSYASASPNQWVAQSFVPTASGKANFASFWSQCDGGVCPATATFELRSNANGQPGNLLATASTDVGLTLGGSPSCVPLTAAPSLTAGTTYWAVMRSPGAPVSWRFQNNTTKSVLQSTNQGATWSGYGYSKTFALKVEQGPGSRCGAAVRTVPDFGTKFGWVTSGGGVVNDTLYVYNDGNTDLNLTAGRITGPGASSFSLLDAPPGPLAKAFRFPRSIPVGTAPVAFIYVVCNGSVAGGLRTATLEIDTNDPNRPTISYPLECNVDTAPPNFAFEQTANGQNGWWRSQPASLTVRGNDGSGVGVQKIECTDSLGPNLGQWGGVLEANLTGEGIHKLSCTATDHVGNRSAAKTAEVRIDTAAPVVSTATRVPEANAKGWNQGPLVVRFGSCTDPAPGSGVAADTAKGDVAVTQDTAETLVSPPGTCTDGAGNRSSGPAVRVRLDSTPPEWGAAVTPAPNAAGWNRSDVTVDFTCTDRTSGVERGASQRKLVTAESTGTTVRTDTLCMDNAGWSAAAGSVGVKLDKTPPETELVSPPAFSGRQAQLDVRVTDATSGNAGIQCRLDDAAAFTDCPSPVKLDSLAAGAHTLRVRGTDAAGNVDPTPASWTWTVDLEEPETTMVTGPPGATRSLDATFRYAGDGGSGSAVAAFECRVDSGAWASCPATGATYSNLGAGDHAFDVRARDAAGNVDSSPAGWTWAIDRTGPRTTLRGPRPVTVSRDATIEITSVDSGGSTVAAYECALDGTALGACDAPLRLTGLQPGTHTVSVRAFDAVGNAEDDAKTWSWRIAEKAEVADDQAATAEDRAVVVDVVANDITPDDPEVGFEATSARGGTLALTDGDRLRYTPPADYSGADSFAYAIGPIDDPASPRATVTVDVSPVNDAPTLRAGGDLTVDAGAYAAPWASALSAGPGEDGQRLTLAVTAVSSPGLFTEQPALSPSGELRFTTAQGASGAATVSYRLSDDGGTGGGGADTTAGSFTIGVRAPAPQQAGSQSTAPAIATAPATGTALAFRAEGAVTAAPMSKADARVLPKRAIRVVTRDGVAYVTVTPRFGKKVTRAAVRVTATTADGRTGSIVVTVITGTRRNDRIAGTPGIDLIYGGRGADRLRGRAGDDVLSGGAGNDRLFGGAGTDRLVGGGGDNRLRD